MIVVVVVCHVRLSLSTFAFFVVLLFVMSRCFNLHCIIVGQFESTQVVLCVVDEQLDCLCYVLMFDRCARLFCATVRV